MESDIGTEQNDIHVGMRNVRLVRSATRVQKRCYVLLYSVKLVQSKVKSK